MGKKYEVMGNCKVFVKTTFEDDGITDLDDQAMDALKEAADISEAGWSDAEDVYDDNWEIEQGSLRAI